MANEQIAWLAGLLEGDGSFELSKNGRNVDERIPRIRLQMLDKDIVERVANMWSGTVTSGLTPKGDKIIYKTTMARRAVLEDLLPKLLPYMGERRTLMINKMLAHYKEREVDHR